MKPVRRADERRGDVLEGSALGVDREEERHHPTGDHDDGTEQVAEEQLDRLRTVADQGAVDRRGDRAEALRDGEEHGDRLRPDLQREDLADREVGGAGARRGEVEDDAPGDRLGDGVEHTRVEQERRDGQEQPGQHVGARDHLPAADRVEQVPDRERPGEVADGERDEEDRRGRRRDAVELAQHQRVGEEDRVVEERLGDHQRRAEHRAGRVVAEEHPGERQIADLRGGLQVQRLALVDLRQGDPGLLDLVLDVGDRLLGLALAAVHHLPPGALRKVAAHEQDDEAEHRADEEGNAPAHREAQDVEEDQAAERAEDRARPVGAVDHDVDAAPVARRDELVDGRVDRGVLAADAHARDEAGEVEVADPERAVAERERGEAAAHQVHAQGDHEEVAAPELVGQAAEEQRADDLAREVHGGDEPRRGGGQRQRLRLGEHVGDRAGHRDLEPVEDPRHPEGDHHPRVERRPWEPVDPRGNEAAHHTGCWSRRRHLALFPSSSDR